MTAIRTLAAAALMTAWPCWTHAEVAEYTGSPEALPAEPYVHVVSEAESPVRPTYVASADGAYVAVAVRTPAGPGPFPAVVIFHGAPGGRGMEQLIGWSRGDHGGPVWERFLREGFVVAVADYRGGPWNEMNTPSEAGLTTAIDDGIAVVEHVRSLPEVAPARVSVYGVSLGGNLAMFLASRVPDLHAVVAGAPAPIWFLGARVPTDGTRPAFDTIRPVPEATARHVAPIRAPVLIQVGTVDPLLPLARLLHDELDSRGKSVRLEIYEHGYHDFVLGPQGQPRPNLPDGEVLLQGALDALDRSVAFVKAEH